MQALDSKATQQCHLGEVDMAAIAVSLSACHRVQCNPTLQICHVLLAGSDEQCASFGRRRDATKKGGCILLSGQDLA